MSNENTPVTVLVVDDDKNTRDGLERALRGTYRVLTAESGARALAIMASHSVDILLSDVRMPTMDGLALLQRALGQKSLLCPSRNGARCREFGQTRCARE